jgi:hypothetical protein
VTFLLDTELVTSKNPHAAHKGLRFVDIYKLRLNETLLLKRIWLVYYFTCNTSVESKLNDPCQAYTAPPFQKIYLKVGKYRLSHML